MILILKRNTCTVVFIEREGEREITTTENNFRKLMGEGKEMRQYKLCTTGAAAKR